MQSAIAENHTLKLGTFRPCTQSPKKANLDNSKSNNNHCKARFFVKACQELNSALRPSSVHAGLEEKMLVFCCVAIDYSVQIMFYSSRWCVVVLPDRDVS